MTSPPLLPVGSALHEMFSFPVAIPVAVAVSIVGLLGTLVYLASAESADQSLVPYEFFPRMWHLYE